jgi:hypothetical protein
MPTSPSSVRDDEPDGASLSRSYAMVVVIEILVLAGLFWLGRHFG